MEGRRTRVGIKKAEGIRPTTFYDVRRSPGNLLRFLFQVSRRRVLAEYRQGTPNPLHPSPRETLQDMHDACFPLLFVA